MCISSVGLEGYVRLEVYNARTHKKTQDSGWFKNLITDIGLDALAQQNDVLIWFHVGNSSTLPLATDTWLNAWVASTNTTRTTTTGTQSSTPFFGFKRITKRFAEGAATGNLQEVGVGWSNTSGTAFSHALIQDPLGNPISITVLADEYLDFTYELRYKPPVADATGVISIDGISYNYTTRALDVTNPSWWADDIGTLFTFKASSESFHRAYTGSLAAVTAQAPQGTDGGSGSGTTNVTVQGYVAGSHKRNFTVTADTTKWNVSGGVIRSLVLACKGTRWQTEFSKVSDGTGIDKNSSFGLFMNWEVSWARAA